MYSTTYYHIIYIKMRTCDHRHNVPVILGMIAPTIDMIYGYVWCLCCDVAVDNLEIRIHKTNSAVTVETMLDVWDQHPKSG